MRYNGGGHTEVTAEGVSILLWLWAPLLIRMMPRNSRLLWEEVIKVHVPPTIQSRS